MRLVRAVLAGVLASRVAFGQGVVVHPSGPTLAANTLRLSVTFERQPTGDPELELAGATSPVFVRPYLWTADRSTLTVLFDPARLKTGVGANAALGRVLQAGSEVALTLDGRTVHSWRVTAAVTAPPDPASWRVESPTVGSLDPIRIAFDRPIDALSRDLIAIVAPDGQAVPGTAVLDEGELAWRFVPEAAWIPGHYRIAISPALEDASGNAIAGAFERAPGIAPPSAPPPLDFFIR